MKTLIDFVKKTWGPLTMCLIMVIMAVLAYFSPKAEPNGVLKDYKDGIQNHLVWSNTGKCFFVRPNDDVTVYLIQVPDCNKGN